MYLSTNTLHFLSLIYLHSILLVIFLFKYKFYPTEFFNDSEFFVPNNPTYNELYVSELCKKDLKNIKYLAIIPNSDSFVSKNNLWNILRNTEFSDIVPKTYLLDNYHDSQKFSKDFQKDKLYILKKNVENKKGVKIISAKLNSIIEEYYKNDYKLIQEFIKNTLLGKQFVIRIYILAIKRKNLAVEVYSHKYNKLVFGENLITNNKIKSNYRNIDSIPDNQKIRDNMERVLKGIKFIIKKQETEILPDLVKYQLFGIDLICDDNYECYLLEINKNPDMSDIDENEKQEKEKIKFEMIELVKNAKNLANYKIL